VLTGVLAGVLIGVPPDVPPDVPTGVLTGVLTGVPPGVPPGGLSGAQACQARHWRPTENVEKQEVKIGRWGLPERMSNTYAAFSWLGGRAVVVSRSSEGWVSICTVASADVGEVFRP
jgi:hypothetical protein